MAHTAFVSTPIIRPATLLDAGWYGAVVCSLILSPSQILCNSHIDHSCLSFVMISRILCRHPEHGTSYVNVDLFEVLARPSRYTDFSATQRMHQDCESSQVSQ